MACSWDWEDNLKKAEHLIRSAAQQGAQIILIQELFEAPYFCKDQNSRFFDLARPIDNHPALQRLSALAAELSVVLPVSLFERANTAFYNSLVVLDADGRAVGKYRKSHIPQGPGYQEKFYFNPGDTGLVPIKTRYGTIGCAICWDQWFPEAARILSLRGAELLFYPTAIGSEPQDPTLDSRDHWTRTMQGHAAANMVPVIASNRIGREDGDSCSLTFYGSSFIAGPTGELVQQADRETEGVLIAEFDLEAIRRARASWGLFRDRRPDLYRPLLSLDGAADATA